MIAQVSILVFMCMLVFASKSLKVTFKFIAFYLGWGILVGHCVTELGCLLWYIICWTVLQMGIILLTLNYFIGQIELFSHVPVLRNFVEHLKRKNFNVCAVHLLDSQVCLSSASFTMHVSYSNLFAMSVSLIMHIYHL